jgi:protein arginine N-methyltransferase 5
MDQVIVVNSDMRDWKPTEKIDILVSELLGSFGDNELSPECLDGVQRVLSATGIMIPARYDSHLVPVSSPRIYESIKAYKDKKNYETPFVVKFDQVEELADPLLVWKFEHPTSVTNQASNSNLHNERYSKLEFKIKSTSLMHGLGGYFEAILYKDIKLSILPSTKTPGMFSWFPMYFPILHPIIVSQDSSLDVYIWRLTDNKKVWYEWMIESSFGVSSLHNPNGQSFWIGL